MPITTPGGGSITVGTTVFTGGTTGSVLFVGAASVVQQDNLDFFWDSTNNRLGIGNETAAGTGRRAVTSGDFVVLGENAAVDVNGRTAIYYTGNGYADPGAVGSSSIGEKLVFSDLTASSKGAIGVNGNGTIWFQSLNAAGNQRFTFWGAQAGTGTGSILATITGDASGVASFCVANASAIATSQTAYVTGDYVRIGIGGAASGAANKTAIIFNNNGFAIPDNAGSSSNGDKLVFWNAASVKTAIGMTTNKGMYFQAVGASTEGFIWHSANTGTTAQVMALSSAGLLTLSNATLLATNVALTNGAGVGAGTITNAPAAGNPTKWIPINDNGTTRYIPAW